MKQEEILIEGGKPMNNPHISYNQENIDKTYVKLAAAIPQGTTGLEALRASCKLVGDILDQMSKGEFDDILFEATSKIIKCEYNIFLDNNKR